SGAAVRRVVDGPGRNEERLARAERHRRLAVLLEDDGAFEDVADFLAGMGVAADGAAGLELRHRRDGFAAGDREIALLKNRALEAALLCAGGGSQKDRGNGDACCAHVDLL